MGFKEYFVYGLGYTAGPCGSIMMIDAIDDYEDKYGMAFSFQGPGLFRAAGSKHPQKISPQSRGLPC